MKSIQIKITDPHYIHHQMAQKLAAIAGKYTCDVNVIVGTTKANAKSLINLMSAFAEIKLPAKIEVQADGWTDQEDALKEISEFFGK